MFTGIVREIGAVAEAARAQGLMRLAVFAPKTAGAVTRLESVAVNGVCLSIVRVKAGVLEFELIPETVARTTLGRVKRGDRLNLEPSLSVTDRLNGHVMFGHIDGVGEVVQRRQRAAEFVLRIRVGRGLRRFLVEKGPIAVDGVSLTVGPRPASTAFAVHLIPETLRQTTLGGRRVGDRVNLEVDYLAKLVLQQSQWGQVGRC